VAGAAHQLSIWDLLTQRSELVDVHGGTRKALADFVLMVQGFQAMLHSHSAAVLGEEIARRTGVLKDLFADKTPEGVSRYENIQELLAGMKEFSERDAEGADVPRTLSDFLIDVALLTDADNDDPNDNDRVSLMTIHSAKGLEFPHVHIVGLEEDLFPNLMAVQTRADLEEERRLFYVALTRAEKRCTLSYAMSRYKWGNLTASEPSRFIDEIDPRYLETAAGRERTRWGGDQRRSSDPLWAQRNTPPPPTPRPVDRSAPARTGLDRPLDRPIPARQAPAPGDPPPPSPQRRSLKRITGTGSPLEATSGLGGEAPELAEGMTVEHERFGKGKVLKVEGRAPDLKATVFFPSAGQKQLLLRFAKLRVVEE